MKIEDEINALFQEFPAIKNDLYWKTWRSMKECRYDDPVFMKLYEKMNNFVIEWDVDHLPDNLKQFWFELNTDLAKVEYHRLKTRCRYIEPHKKETKEYYSNLEKFFDNRERLEEAEYCVEGGDVEFIQEVEDSVEEGLKTLRDNMDEKTKEVLDNLRDSYNDINL